MASTTVNWGKSSTDYFPADMDDQWADLNHPLFYYDPRFKGFCLQKLAELEQLGSGWDADGAPPMDGQILDAVRRFVASLPQHIATRPMVVPLTSGGVQLEWHRGRQVLELEFETPDTVHYLKWDPEAGVEEEDLVPAADRDTLVNLIRWFMKGMLDG